MRRDYAFKALPQRNTGRIILRKDAA